MTAIIAVDVTPPVDLDLEEARAILRSIKLPSITNKINMALAWAAISEAAK